MLVLIDGNQLTKLMIKYNLGVAVEQTYEVKRVDSDKKEVDKQKTPADCLTCKAADGRKPCEDAGSDIIPRGTVTKDGLHAARKLEGKQVSEHEKM